MKADANKECLDNEAARLYSEIAALRQQLKYAQQNMQDSIRNNDAISKAMNWLEANGTLFDSYNDVTVRRFVDTIRVNADQTITVYLKGGAVITESLKGEQMP